MKQPFFIPLQRGIGNAIAKLRGKFPVKLKINHRLGRLQA